MKTVLLTALVVVFIGGGLIWLISSGDATSPTGNQNNVAMVNGKQIIEITARGGYAPRATTAKAGVPTIIKLKTNGTFDCSSSVVIPSLGYRNYLPATGETEVVVPEQKPGAVIQGTCAMGMYHFNISFN